MLSRLMLSLLVRPKVITSSGYGFYFIYIQPLRQFDDLSLDKKTIEYFFDQDSVVVTFQNTLMPKDSIMISILN
jgi:hypothetical protein